MSDLRRSYAKTNPGCWIELSNETGTWQVFGCDGRERWQLTNAPGSVATMVVDPVASVVAWWQDDDDGWQVQDFRSAPGSHRPLSTDLPRAKPDGGLVLTRSRAIVPLATPGEVGSWYTVEGGRVTQIAPRKREGTDLELTGGRLLREFAYAEMLPWGSRPARYQNLVHWYVVQHEPEDRGALGLMAIWPDLEHPSKFVPLPLPPAGELADTWSNHLHVHRKVLAVSPGGTRLVAGFDDGPHTRLYEMNLDALEPHWRLLPTPRGRITAVHFTGAEGDTVEYRWGAIGKPWCFRTLDDPPPPDSPIRWQHVRVPWGDGPEGASKIPVTLVFPDGDPPLGGWPVVVVAHGGPHIHAGNQPLEAAGEELRQAGNVLALVEYPGSTGYGRAYRRAAFGNLGVVEGNSLRVVARWLKNSDLPIRRRFVWTGGSYAGLPVLIGAALAAQAGEEDLVAAIALRAPECDPMKTWEVGTARTRRVLEERMGGSPSQVPEQWRAASPLTYAHLLRCPTFLVRHGDDVHVNNDAITEFQARNPTMVEVVTMAGGHNARTQSTTIAATSDRERVDFLLRHLRRPDPPKPRAATGDSGQRPTSPRPPGGGRGVFRGVAR